MQEGGWAGRKRSNRAVRCAQAAAGQLGRQQVPRQHAARRSPLQHCCTLVIFLLPTPLPQLPAHTMPSPRGPRRPGPPPRAAPGLQRRCSTPRQACAPPAYASGWVTCSGHGKHRCSSTRSGSCRRSEATHCRPCQAASPHLAAGRAAPHQQRLRQLQQPRHEPLHSWEQPAGWRLLHAPVPLLLPTAT